MELTPSIDVDAILSEVKTQFERYIITDIDGIKIDFPDKWVHLRKSNTEPVIRICAEATSSMEAQALCDDLIRIIKDLSAN